MTIMNKEDIDDLIIRFLSDQATTEEVDFLSGWRKEATDNETYFRNIEEIWFSSLAKDAQKLFTRTDVNEAYQQFCRNTKSNRYFSLRSLIKYAAAVAVVLLMMFGTYKVGENRLFIEEQFVRIEAPSGAKTNVTLPDGTKVCLNAGSYISYSPRFGIKEREVNICGEAYFDVARNENVPFLVKSETMQVKVLGTKFDFRDYPSDENAMVTLSEGKVNFTNLLAEGDSFIMLPSDQVILNKEEKSVLKKRVISQEVIQWKENRLHFDEEPMRDVLNAIERSYNVDIVLQTNSLDTLKFYGSFKTDEQTIDDVMEVLSTTQKMKYNIDGRKVTIN